MLNRNMSKLDIEKCLNSKGNFIKIDYLTKFLKEDIPIDLKKFCYIKLAQTYENMKLFSDAAKTFGSIAILSIAFTEKIKNHIMEAKNYVKASEFAKADEATKKAMSQGNSFQKDEAYIEIKEFYKKVAQDYEKDMKRNNASKVYEKLLEMKISENERKEIKEKLNELYEKLGKKINLE